MIVQAPQCAEMEALTLLNETLEFSPPSFPFQARGRSGGGKWILFSHLPSSPSSFRKLPLAAVMHISEVDLNSTPWQINSLKLWNCCRRGWPWPRAGWSCSFPRLQPSLLGRQGQTQTGCNRSIPLPSVLWLLVLSLPEPEEGRESMDYLPSVL